MDVQPEPGSSPVNGRPAVVLRSPRRGWHVLAFTTLTVLSLTLTWLSWSYFDLPALAVLVVLVAPWSALLALVALNQRWVVDEDGLRMRSFGVTLASVSWAGIHDFRRDSVDERNGLVQFDIAPGHSWGRGKTVRMTCTDAQFMELYRLRGRQSAR
ncbi:MAG TPA: hypothetical protein VJ976_02420 [Ornithinimicrobium sp.]|uniref:hypothetical protein n=1 Tax=Ornithinimicrobium sp. TaxID=1977084 RepID=UPI002B47E924|nr:hypothetical protein [Ornithinimicrobium sp.]HKJ11225.1 hypothetical protein [Ornithinimicrobium sp.]